MATKTSFAQKLGLDYHPWLPLVLCQARLGLKATGFGLACTGFRPGKPQAKPGARRSGRAPAWLWLGPQLLAPNALCGGGVDGLGLQ